MTAFLVSYHLTGYEEECIESARAERGRTHNSQAFAFGWRCGLIACLAMVATRAGNYHPMRMNEQIEEEIADALSLAACNSPERVRAWLLARHMAPAAVTGRLIDVEYAAAAGAANAHLTNLVRVVEVLTCG
jgi:hypothetical protein